MVTASDVKKILIVEDHPLARRGIAALLQEQGDLVVCAEAENIAGAIKAVDATDPDMAIVDLVLQDCSGLDLVRRLRARKPGLPVLVLSMHDEAFYAERALRAGAMGYVAKTEDGDIILRAVREVLAGRMYVNPALAGRMLSDLIGGTGGSPVHRLTDREFEVFELLGQGLQTRQIADRLHISVGTVDAHREHIKKKLDIPSAQKLLVFAVQWSQTSRGG
jgi:DNA-binding NarL/FixJ family response regulator